MTPFEKAFAAARAQKQRTFEFPPGSGKMYTTQTREEAAYASPSRQRDVVPARRTEMRSGGMPPPTRAEIPTGGTPPAPRATGGGMSETQRNMLNTLGAMGGMAGMARLTQANRAATAARAPTARVEPTLGAELPLMPVRADRIPAFKKGGLVKKPKMRK